MLPELLQLYFLIPAAASENRKRKTTDNNEPKTAAKKKTERREGFERGLHPERIIGATDTSGELMVSPPTLPQFNENELF